MRMTVNPALLISPTRLSVHSMSLDAVSARSCGGTMVRLSMLKFPVI
jgi:hypothetical protein